MDGEEESPRATAADGAKPAPQPKSGCVLELVSVRKNHGVQPRVSDGVPNWLGDSKEED